MGGSELSQIVSEQISDLSVELCLSVHIRKKRLSDLPISWDITRTL